MDLPEVTPLRVGSALRKVCGGKTVKVDLRVSDEGIITDVVISGDFFLYPEEYIHLIEESIRGRGIEEAIAELGKFRDRVEILGATFDDLINLLKEAYQKSYVD